MLLRWKLYTHTCTNIHTIYTYRNLYLYTKKAFKMETSLSGGYSRTIYDIPLPLSGIPDTNCLIMNSIFPSRTI